LILGFLLWRRMGWHHHRHHTDDGERTSSVMDH
jgi:hypothetical protein